MIPIILTHHYSDALYLPSRQEMKLDLDNCKKASKKYKIEFLEYVARCINHEYLHYILHIEQDIRTSTALDNIAKKYIDYWMW